MSRLALIFTAASIAVSGFAFGASVAIGPRAVVEVALGNPIEGPSSPALRVLAEARSPGGSEPSESPGPL